MGRTTTVNFNNFEYYTSSSFFNVLIFNDYVVKIPKHHSVKERYRLKEIVEIQNYLADNIENCLPCKLIEGMIVMPKAKGKRLDSFSEEEQLKFRGMLEELRKKINDLGIDIIDIYAVKNSFYDEETGKLTYIDYCGVGRI